MKPPPVRSASLRLLSILFAVSTGCSSSGGTPQTQTPSEGGLPRPDAGRADAPVFDVQHAEGGREAAASDAVHHDVLTGDAASNDATIEVSFEYDAPTHDAPLSPDSACVSVVQKARARYGGVVDILFAVDNSESMRPAIDAIEANLEPNFARPLSEAGADYRIILLSLAGPRNKPSVCIPSPPGGSSCSTPLAENQAPENNAPRFFHYDEEVGPSNALCLLYDTYFRADRHGQCNGWRTWSRSDTTPRRNAIHFVVVSDRAPNCSSGPTESNPHPVNVSNTEHDILVYLSLSWLNTDYYGQGFEHQPWVTYHSIVGMAPNNPVTRPYSPDAPIVSGTCSTAVGSGFGYQRLSTQTRGIRFPVCETAHFGMALNAIVNQITFSGATCELAVPVPDHGVLDPTQVSLRFVSGEGVDSVIPKVESQAVCGDAPGFYFDNPDNPTTVLLCPASCDVVQTDSLGRLEFLLGCFGG